MNSTVTMPLWLFVLILLFAVVTFASHFLFPSVRWFFRRRMERVVARLNERLERPIQPFKLARRHDMIQRLIYDPQVTEAIVAHAKEKGVPENVAFEEARRYARSVVPSFSAVAYFGFAIRAAKWLSTSFYRVRLGHHAEQALSEIDRDDTVVFVMNHRSNMDYVLVTYLAADRSALSYAVGEWAQVWPLSRLIRAMGAYFIQRKSRNDLYRKVLARYVALATAGGVTQAMFPEGGLSVTGALMPPKLGLLKYIVDGFDGTGRDVVFVPVALNYDRVLEDRILIAAQARTDGRFGAKISVVVKFIFKQIWLRLRGKFHRYGYAAVSFGEPLSLRDYLKDQTHDPTKPLAKELMKRIGNNIPVLPVPLVAHILKGSDGLTRDQIATEFRRLLKDIKGGHIHLPRDDADYAVTVGLRALSERGMIVETDDLYTIPQDQIPAVTYYANSLSHLFLENFNVSAGA